MAINYRYSLRTATDIALGLFVLFAAGGLLWTADEFLRWNLLPDWIDKYAQVIIIVLGASAGLAVATTLLSALVLIAEAAAEYARIPAFTPPRRALRLVLAASLLVLGVFFCSSQIDAYRKRAAMDRQRSLEFAKYRDSVQSLQNSVRKVAGLFPPPILASLESGAAPAGDGELIRFLSAVSSSMEFHPAVGLLVRASAPYQYCHIRLVPRADRPADGVLERFGLQRQFYLSFPSAEETEAIGRLFGGEVPPVQARVEGEVLDTVRPSAWAPIGLDGKVIGLLVLNKEERPGFDFRHFGPASPL